MSTRWRTACWARRTAAALLASFLLAAAGCSMLPQAEETEQLELLEEIKPPAIAKKPEYQAASGTIERKAAGTGRMMAMLQQGLHFGVEGQRVKKVHVAEGDDVRKGEVLAELETDDLTVQILGKNLEIARKEEALRQSLRSGEADSDAGKDQLRLAQLELELLHGQLDALKEDQAGSVIVAPFDGKVTVLDIEAGDRPSAYETVAVVADPSALVAAVSFGGNDLKTIAVGMEAEVELNGIGTRKGEVIRLPADTSADADQESPDPYVLIRLDDGKGVAAGVPLTAKVVTDRRENAVLIPPAALRTNAGRTYVQTVEADGSKREVDVEIGLTTATEVEVVKGLEPGRKVVGK